MENAVASRHSCRMVPFGPKSLRARRLASSGLMPSAMSASSCSARCAAMSASSSDSNSALRVQSCHADRKRRHMSHLFRRGRHDCGNAEAQPVPLLLLGVKVLLAARREAVELRSPSVVALTPLEFQQTVRFEAVQRRIERPLRNLQDVTRELLDAEEDAVSM